MKEVQHAMVRLMNTADGKKVLEHLKSRTLNRTLALMPQHKSCGIWKANAR